MKKQNDLQWFLIKKFIEILAVVGVVEYLLTFLVNRFVLPNVLLYFFPGVEENPLLLGSGVIFFLSAVLMLLILGALNAMFPSPLHEMVQAALEQMQKNFMHTVSAGKTNFSFYELNRGQAILLFLVAFVVVLVILTPYVLGAVCFAKITIKEFRQIQREREEEQKEFDRKRNLMLSDIAHDLRTPMTTVNGYAKALADALQKQGFKILTGGTDNHLMLLDLRGMDISGKELQNRCDEVFITLNKNTVPNDPRSPFVTSGVRIGTPAVTTRGLKEEDMPKIAECIWLAATDFENKKEYIKAEVTKLCDKYPLYE